MASASLSSDQFDSGPISSKPGDQDALKHDHYLEGNDRDSQEAAPRPTKRNACQLCRKRKLRCDGGQPSCATCARLRHDCIYVESRRKSGPKRGYVRTLETRLAQVEELLKQHETGVGASSTVTTPADLPDESNNGTQLNYADVDIGYATSELPMESNAFNSFLDVSQSQVHSHLFSQIPEEHDIYAPPPVDSYNGISWALIEMGVDEPLPLQETIDDLNTLYFSRVHPTYPMINEYRFRTEMNRSPQTRPSVALRYAMWATAASTVDRYKELHTHFYARARKYAEADEATGRHKYINVRHAQAWLLICTYEFQFMHFPHAYLSTGRAIRLTQMMGLHRLDGVGLDAKQTVPESSDWWEKEERRRTFWMAFCKDRNASIGTGWPMIIDERDITTHMPSSDDSFLHDSESSGISLTEAMLGQHASTMSAFAGVVLISALSGRTFHHLQRPSPKNDDHDLNGEFWRAHRKIDNVLLNTSLYLPAHLRLPTGSSNSNIIFLNMGLQAATIVVHQAAMFKAEKFNLADSIIAESKTRCITAAVQIASIMRMIAHLDLSVLNTYTTFVLFLATRIFALAARRDPVDDNARSSAHFLLSALSSMRRAMPLAGIYIVQLEAEGIGLESLEDSTGLEKIVSNISLKDDTSDPSWVKFVSPLVRITEHSDHSSVSGGKSNSASKSSPDARDDFSSQPESRSQISSSLVGGANILTSSSGGSYTLDSGSYFSNAGEYGGNVAQLMDGFVQTGTWGLDGNGGTQNEESLDGFMNMEGSSGWADTFVAPK